MRDLKTNLLRYHQREQLKGEIRQAEDMLSQAKPEDRGTINANISRTKRQLESQSPVPLTSKEKDTLSGLEKKLIKKITHNMPPEEVMRKNPAGAVDWHMKWEKINKPLIRMWKNVRIQLNPDSQDRDLSNIERYRPSGQLDHLRSDAQIPGVMSYHNISDEQWPFDPPTNTASEQNKRVYSEGVAEAEVDAALDEVTIAEDEEESIKTESPEQRAALLDRLSKARAALAQKRADAKQLEAALVETTEAV
jgi:hypothetical protein